MADGYVVLYIKGKQENDNRTKQILERFEKLNIRHKVVDLDEEFTLYGNKMTLEGVFTLDFSGMGDIKVPRTPLAVAEKKVSNGFDEILEDLEYFRRNYAE